MRELRPFIVTAPLSVHDIDVVDTDVIYIFDYKNSFLDNPHKPQAFMTYLETFGGMFDVYIEPTVSYDDREKLLIQYFTAGSFFNIYTLVETMVQVLCIKKEIFMDSPKSILTPNECLTFIKRNKGLVDKFIELYDSLFLIMLMFSTNIKQTMSSIKGKYSPEHLKGEELSPNMCNLLLDKNLYKYYDKHVGIQTYYYTFLFDNNLYKSKGFLNILTNKNNTLLPVLIDMTNNKFLEYLEKQKKEG